ncbi:MAG: hypothetical protein COV71_00300 [Candidatus Omnitrophica bacterium CG11_big_fil_rev_8_21_14_0_20_41_12]|nr:MAG: hypothetical protein COV71_00300 [Candidatus Omnitrophica bacterium CG11_big_fil_rev_8_21_14_0_20_41_12]
MILRSMIIFVILIFIMLFFISKQLFANSKNIDYCDISDFSMLKENNCQKCNINIGKDVLYRALYLGKFRYDNSGTSNDIDVKILLRLCEECAKKCDLIDKMLIFSRVDNIYNPVDSFERNDLAKCSSCGLRLGTDPYYVIDAREEKEVNNEIEILDTIAVFQLCENCMKKYDLSKIKIGIYK